MVVQADDVPGYRLLNQHSLTGLEGHGIGDLYVLGRPNVAHFHALGVAPRADPNKGYPVPVFRIHIGLDFENKAREIALPGIDQARLGGPGQRLGGPLNKIVQHLPNTEIAQGGPEKNRG